MVIASAIVKNEMVLQYLQTVADVTKSGSTVVNLPDFKTPTFRMVSRCVATVLAIDIFATDTILVAVRFEGNR